MLHSRTYSSPSTTSYAAYAHSSSHSWYTNKQTLGQSNIEALSIISMVVNYSIMGYFIYCLFYIKGAKLTSKLSKFMIAALWLVVSLRCSFYLFQYDALHFVSGTRIVRVEDSVPTFVEILKPAPMSISQILLIAFGALSQLSLHFVEALVFLLQGIQVARKTKAKSLNGIIYMMSMMGCKIYFGMLVIFNVPPNEFYVLWITIPLVMIFVIDMVTLLFLPSNQTYMQAAYSCCRSIIETLYLNMHFVEYLGIRDILLPTLIAMLVLVPGKILLAKWYQSRYKIIPISSFREEDDYIKLVYKLMDLYVEIDNVYSVGKIYEIYEINKSILGTFYSEEDNSDLIIRSLGKINKYEMSKQKSTMIISIFEEETLIKKDKHPMEYLFNMITEIFTLAKAKFNKSCEIRILEAQFELNWKINPFSSLRQLYNAELYSPSIKQRCKIYNLKSSLERMLIKAYDMSCSTKQGQDDMKKLYSYQIHYNEWIELIDLCTTSIYEFWCNLAKEKISNSIIRHFRPKQVL